MGEEEDEEGCENAQMSQYLFFELCFESWSLLQKPIQIIAA